MSAKVLSSAPDDSTASIWKRPAEPLGAREIRLTVVLVLHLDAVRRQLRVDQRAQARVDGREHLGELLELGDREAPGRQALGHLEPDVAGAHDHRAGGLILLDRAHQLEGVTHGVQQVHPVGGPEGLGTDQALDGRPGRDGPGPDHELVVGDLVLDPGLVDHMEPVAGDVDLGGQRVEAHLHPGRLEVVECAVRQVAPVGDLTRDVVGDAADGEVGVGVGHDDGDLGRRVELACPQGGADAGVAAADRYEVHGRPFVVGG